MRNIADLKKEFEEQFGTTLTARQLWALVKFAKHVRLRCRNNAAFNNFANAFFGPRATFRTVQKTRTSYKTGQPEYYPGLSIEVIGEHYAPGSLNEDDEE